MMPSEHGNATGPANRATFQSTEPRAGILKLEDCTGSLWPLNSLFKFCVLCFENVLQGRREGHECLLQGPSCNPMESIAMVVACRVDPDGEINTDNESDA